MLYTKEEDAEGASLWLHSVVEPAPVDGARVLVEDAATFVPRLDDITLIYYQGCHYDAFDFQFREGIAEEALRRLGDWLTGRDQE